MCQINLNWVGIDYDICWNIFWLFENSASWTKFVYFVTYRMPQRKLGQKNLPHLQVPSLKSVSTRSEFSSKVKARWKPCLSVTRILIGQKWVIPCHFLLGFLISCESSWGLPKAWSSTLRNIFIKIWNVLIIYQQYNLDRY